MANRADLLSVTLEAFNSLSERQYSSLDFGTTFDELGADSLAMQQVLMHIEDGMGETLPDHVLERIVDVETIGQFHDLLKSHYEPA